MTGVSTSPASLAYGAVFPVLGWPAHGNFYVVMTLLIGAAEVIRRRWLTLMTHIPLLPLDGRDDHRAGQ